MKKSIALVVFLAANFAIAQKATVFENKILAEKKYALETVVLNNMDMDVPGQNKMTIMQEIKGPFSMTTSKPAADGSIPAELAYGEVTIKQMFNGQPQDQKSPVSGTIVLGSFDNAGKFSIQSIKGGETTEELKALISKMLEGNLKQIAFPKKAIAIGESFEDTTPMNIPLGQLGTMEATIKTAYTLVKIENGIGYFDMKQNLTMTASPQGMEMKTTGTGTGKLEMSLADKYMKKMASIMDMDMEFTAQGTSVKMKSKATTSTTVAVTNR